MGVKQAWTQRVVVQSGGIIEIHTPGLPPGTEAEVIVLVGEKNDGHRPLTDLIGIGSGLYGSAAAIDADLDRLRNEWDGTP